MHGKNKIICIAGKNQCAIDALNYVIKNYNYATILALANISDKGVDGWQKSFKKFAKQKKIKLVNLSDLYKYKDLYFFSLEYEKIINVKKFKSKNLFNIHFSLLPKFRGCHTNFYQIYKGEKISGVTLHKIDQGIDTGYIIDKIKFMLPLNFTAYENYNKLLKKSVLLFKKNIKKILKNKFKTKKQDKKKGSYYGRNSINYEKLINIKKLNNTINLHNKIRALIFPPFQLPIYNGNKIKKSIYKNKKIKLLYIK